LITHPSRPALIFIDPAGDSYYELLKYIVSHRLEGRTILFDPGEEERIIGYDATRETEAISYKAQLMVEATLKALGIEEMESVLYMPQLRLLFYHLYHSLIEAGLSLAEAEYLLSAEGELRGAVLKRVKTEAVRGFWEGIDRLKLPQRQERLSLAEARLHPFLANEAIRLILSQKRHAIDFERVIDQGQILLVNLQPRAITSEDQRLLGTLLIQDAINATFSRLGGERRDLFIILDEFQDLIPPGAGQIMRAGRKYKLHLILATTSLEDFKETEPALYHQVFGNAQIKVLFGDLPEEALEGLAKEFYLQDLNLKQRKLELYRTFFEPLESERTIESESWGSGEIEAEGSSFVYLGNELFPSRSVRSKSDGRSSHGGGSKSEVPFYEFLEREELSSVQFYPLEELLWKAKAKLKSLGKREIVIKQREKGLRFDQVPKLQPLSLTEEELEEAKRWIYTNQPYYATIEEIEAEREERVKALKPEEPQKKWQKR
jgi:hypothetical protein